MGPLFVRGRFGLRMWAWAAHFEAIGAGEGLVSSQVWDNVPSFSPMDSVFGAAPNELHAALRQMSLGKAAGADEVTAELLRFGGTVSGRRWFRSVGNNGCC